MGPLVAVQILEIRPPARAAELFAAGVLQQGIDLNDIGAPVRELAHAGRPGTDPGQVEHENRNRACEARGKGIQKLRED
jgi:hypothetical protein